MNTPNLGRKLAYETLKYCMENGNTATLTEVYKHLETTVIPTLSGVEEYLSSYDGHSDPKWLTQLKWTLVDFDKAGWFKKAFPKRGYWTITEEGIKALKRYQDPEKLGREANKSYMAWRSKQHPEAQTIILPTIPAKTQLASLDEIIEDADLQIKTRLKDFDPYVFQNIVGAMLTAMGYFVDFIAPKGKDGGIDLVCYQDPMGIRAPRMKVQVKHRPDDAVSRPTLSEFADQIKRDEVGIFVTSGAFSRDARNHAIAHEKHIRLIDGIEFVDLIKTHYSKLDQETQDLLPLVNVFHLRTSIPS